MSANPDPREEVVARAIFETDHKRSVGVPGSYYRADDTLSTISPGRRAQFLAEARAVLAALDKHEAAKAKPVVHLTSDQRDFLKRLQNGAPLRIADRAQDKVRQQMRKAGYAAVVGNPRRWRLTSEGAAALRARPTPEAGE
jgi:hypothetical protein